MKKVAFLFLTALLVTVTGLAAPESQTFSGEIMDSQCASMGSHQMMKNDAKQCTLGCVHNGAKFVLFNAASKTVYQLDDQKKPEQFAGQKVNVKGTLDESSKTIHVQSISKS